MKVLAVALCLVASTLAAAGDVSADTGVVSADFMGASGGMKLFVNSDTSDFLMVQQAKLQEVTPSGSCPGGTCTSINVAGQNSWTDLVETKSETDSSTTTVYSTTFSVEEGGVSFQLAAHLAKTTSTIEEHTPCSGCADITVGPTTNPTSGVCKADSGGECGDYASDTTCSQGMSPCTEEVTVTENELKFSFIVSGFKFQSPDNKFVYGIVLKNKNNADPTLDDSGSGKVASVPGGKLALPTTGILKGGAQDVEVQAAVTTKKEGSKTVIEFEFESWAEGLSLYYDPTLGLDSVSSSPKTAPAAAATLVAALAALVFNA